MNEDEGFLAQIRRIGNSYGVIIPKKEIEKMNLKLGDWVKVILKRVKIIVEEDET